MLPEQNREPPNLLTFLQTNEGFDLGARLSQNLNQPLLLFSLSTLTAFAAAYGTL